MAEMRPWVGESLSIALFETQRDLKVVLCQDELEDPLERLFDENPSPERIDKYVWNDINKAFARPLNRSDLESAYVPTQILAEVFKAEGFDGIEYSQRSRTRSKRGAIRCSGRKIRSSLIFMV